MVKLRILELVDGILVIDRVGGEMNEIACVAAEQSGGHETPVVELKDVAVRCVRKDSIFISRNLQLYYSLRLPIDLGRRVAQIWIKQIGGRR
jgi:hypothetical protein